MNQNIKAGADIHKSEGNYEIGTQEDYDEFVKIRNQSLSKMRIEQIAEKCWSHRINGTLIDGHLHFDYHQFAELIVQECARVILEWKKEPFPYDPDFGVKIIKEHFGIKNE